MRGRSHRHCHALAFIVITCVVQSLWTVRLLSFTSGHHRDGSENNPAGFDLSMAQNIDAANGRKEERNVEIIEKVGIGKRNVMTISNSDAKPFLVLHVGPPKTATTTLQCSLRSHQDTLLKEDLYYVLETEDCRPTGVEKTVENGHGSIQSCFSELNKLNQSDLLQSGVDESAVPPCWKEYMRVLEKLENEGKNVIISNELISRTQPQMKTAAYIPFVLQALQEKFHVVVVIGFRRYFEWIPSCHFELFRPKGQKRRLYKWPGKAGGRLVPTLEEFLTGALETHVKFAYSDTILEAFRDYAQDIRILNVHGESDVETNFYCNALPTAIKTCQAFREGHISRTQQQNAAVPLEYDILGSWAYLNDRIGDVGIQLGRQEVAWRARNFHNETLNQTVKDFPKACPPQALLDRLLNRSIELELKVMPSHLHATMPAQHVEEFEKKVMTNQLYCTVDTEKVLNDEMWSDFFRSNMSTTTTANGNTENIIDTNGASDSSSSKPLETPGGAFTSTTALTNNTTTTNKPFFVLHVGPPKTATTTLQCSLRSHQDTLLKQDSYHVLETNACRPSARDKRVDNGHGHIENCFNELNKMNQTQLLQSDLNATIVPRCWKEHMRVFKELKNEGTSIIISNEMITLTQPGVENAAYIPYVIESLRDSFHVIVVIAYRRYFEWLPSARNELYRPYGWKPRTYMWPGKGGGRAVADYDEFLKRVLETHAKFAYSHTILEAFRDHAPNISILNMHEGDVETNFYCNALPTAEKTCEAFRNGRVKKFQHQNTAVPLDYDMLSSWAYMHDLVGGVGVELGRQEVAWRARNFHKDQLNQTVKDFPKVCPPQDLVNRILKRSLELEQKVIPQHLHSTMHEQHVEAFESKVVKNQLYCTVDEEKVIQDVRWSDFFLSNMTK